VKTVEMEPERDWRKGFVELIGCEAGVIGGRRLLECRIYDS